MGVLYEQIPSLLGYNDVILETEYQEEWLDPNGLKIILNKDSTDYHFITEDKLNEIIQLNRESILDFNDTDIDLKFDWKVGDMCYFEFRVNCIYNMVDNRITGCSDGLGGTSGYSLNDRCFEINIHTLRCSNNVEFYHRWISEKWDNMGKPGYLINHPDLYRILVEFWVDMINEKEGITLELNRFGQSVIDHIDTEDYSLIYNDINIFREFGDNYVYENII